MTDVLVVLPASTRYREPFFDRVIPELADAGIRLRVAQGGAPRRMALRDDIVDSPWSESVRTITFGRAEAPFVFRRAPVSMPRPDFVIVPQSLRSIDAHVRLARSKFRGPPVALWGHGVSASGTQSRRGLALKNSFTLRADWFFSYTGPGAEHLVRAGFAPDRITVLNNTIDTDTLARSLDEVSQTDVERYRTRYGLQAGHTALFLGGLDEGKGIDTAVSAARRIVNFIPGFRLLFGGDGERRSDLERREASGEPLVVLGRVDARAKALALRAADVMFLPGYIGLVAVDSIVAGLPVVARRGQGHAPEAAYLEEAQNTVWTRPQASPDELADEIIRVLSDGSLRADLAHRAKASASKYSMDHMVTAFREGLSEWIAR